MNQDEKFVFLVGCPRSGTYLMASILNHHFSIAIPTETQFIPLFYRFLFLWGDLSIPRNRESLLADIYEFLAIWSHIEATDRDFEKEKHLSLFTTRERMQAVLESATGYPGLVSAMFREYADMKGAKHCGDKTAFASHIPLEHLEECVPDAKFIHMIRDGRDVSLSWRALWCGLKTVTGTARAWQKHVSEKRKWGEGHPARYLEVRYEDSLADPAGTLQAISDFLEIPVQNRDTDFADSEMAQVLGGGGTHPLLARPLDAGNTQKWRKAMPEADQNLCDFLAGETLEEFGYERGAVQGGAFGKTRVRAAYEMAREALTVRAVKYKVKTFLPLIIFFLGILRIRLSQLLWRAESQ